MLKTGPENGKLRQCPHRPNCVSSQATDARHFIEPIRIRATPPEAKKTILQALDEMKTATVVVAEDDYIRAEFVSTIFRFVDDVEFHFPDDNAKELVVHVRSASRVGYSDFGVNRKRMETIRSIIETIRNE